MPTPGSVAVPEVAPSAPNEDELLLLDVWSLVVQSRELRRRITEYGPAATALIQDIEDLAGLLARVLAARLRRENETLSTGGA